MNNVLKQRFTGFAQPVIQTLGTPIQNVEMPPAPPESPIVSPEVLRQKLLEKLNPQPKIVNFAGAPNIELVHFANVYEFAHWYENNRGFFNENQQKPLNTMIEARDLTIGGCNCDREKRKFIAEDYFKKFWTQNAKTDLLPTLQKALNTKKLLFGDFLIFPPLPEL